MKTILLLLATTLVYEEAEGSPANMLADKTLAKMSAWIQTEGPNWATLSGQFDEGIVQGQTNDNYTLALAGPAFNLDGSLSRISEATLTDGDPDPNYASSQKLIFSVAIKNVTVDYRHVAYNDDNNGFFNITSMGTSDGISAQVTIDLKGSGDSCFGFADLVTINFSGNLYVSTAGLQEAFPQVIAAVSNHFRTNVPNAVGLLLEAAVFNSLDGFDICTGVYNPLPQANVMARRIINAMQDGLNQNIQYWAELPGFYKTDSDVNGTTMDQVVVRAGNFSSIGTLTRAPQSRLSHPATIVLDGLDVLVEEKTRFLGLHLDGRLNYDVHVTGLCKQLSSYTFCLRKLKSMANRSVLLTAYHSLVMSRATYAMLFWGSAANLELVFRMQKRALRVLLGLKPGQSCRGKFRENKLMTVPATYVYRAVLFARKLRPWFEGMRFDHGYSTRRTDLMIVPRHRMKFFERCASFSIIKILNHIGDGALSCPIAKVKTTLKKYFIDEEFYSVKDFFQSSPPALAD